jgi:hypothetical protein
MKDRITKETTLALTEAELELVLDVLESEQGHCEERVISRRHGAAHTREHFRQRGSDVASLIAHIQRCAR